MSNVHFMDCNRTGSVVSIIPRCQDKKTQKQIFFSNVKFSKNVVSVDQRLLEVKGSSSCVDLTMQDVAVFENQCEGQDCFLLSSQNTLSRLQIEENRGLETSTTPQAIFTCPADSQSTVNDLEAKENRIRIFQLKTGSLLRVSESLFRGTVSLNPASSDGGVLNSQNSTISLNICSFDFNSGFNGGVLFIQSSKLHLKDCQFSKNSAVLGKGGAVFLNSSTVEIKNCSFVQNEATEDGGALYSESSEFNLRASNFTGSYTRGSGSIFLNNSSAKIHQILLEGNTAEWHGGCFSMLLSNLNISNSFFTSCKAMKNGGAFYLEQCTANLKEVKIHSNEASKGGGMYLEQSKANLKTSEIHSNEASNGGGIYIVDKTVLQGLELVLTSNSARNNGGSIFTNSSELKISNSSFIRNEAYYNGSAIHSESSLLSLDAVHLTGSYSSHSGTLCLRNSSTILNTVVFFENTVDWFGGSVDTIGSDLEIQDSDFLNNSASAGPGLSLRYQSSARISNCTFHSNSARFYGSIHINEASQVSIKKSSFLNNTSNAGSGVYLVTGSSVEVQDSVFSENFARYAGGAIFARFDAKLSISGSNFTNNEAEVIQGGAIFSETSTVFMYNCLLDVNTANEGGGLFISEANLEILDSKFINCKAITNGGALYLKQATGYLKKTSLESNLALFDGGGILATEESRVFGEGLILKSNEAKVKGGGLAVLAGSTYTCQSCTIENNTAQTGPQIYKDSE